VRGDDGVQLNPKMRRRPAHTVLATTGRVSSPLARGDTSSPEPCTCAFCKGDRQFAVPPHLLEELLKGNVVVFAGAGISTENRVHATTTLYERIAHEIDCEDDISFPELMEKYCAQPDGRIKLIASIKDRFDYFLSFEDFYLPMTRFHRAISPLYMIENVITTNWDDFFERECDFDAFVNDSDMALWGASKRRLMKIHG
jgi:NAD-dependent SIR2 family protein deacetylase